MKIIHWNARSIQNKLDELKQLASDNEINIVALNETHLDAHKTLKAPGYKIYRNDRNKHGGGVALFIKNDIEHYLYKTPKINNVESLSVMIKMNNLEILIISIYIPPKIPINYQDFSSLFLLHNHVLLVGDLNASHTAWNCHYDSKRGKTLMQFCINNNISIHYPNEPTHYPVNNKHRPSTIDLVLTKNFNQISPPKALCKLSSDHTPIYFKTTRKFSPLKKPNIYNLNKTNWSEYRRILNNNTIINPIVNNSTDIDNLVNNLTNNMLSAMQQTTPLINNNTAIVDNLPNHIKILIKIKNKFRKRFQKTRMNLFKKIVNKLTSKISQYIKNWKNEKWSNYLSKLTPGNGTLWRATKIFKNQFNNIPPLNNNGIYVYDPIDKANHIADYFESVHSQNNNLGSNNKTLQICRKVRQYLKTIPNKNTSCDITNPKEVQNILKKLKNRKAPGSDTLHVKLLKNLPKTCIIYLTHLINNVLIFGYFPSVWKTAKIIILHKSGKKSSLASSYRPISLLSSLSKIVEKIILIRLKEHIFLHNIIPNEQFGFKDHHSTVMQLGRLTDHITHNFNLNKYTGVAFLDIEKAFDTVWIQGLIHKLITYKFPDYLIKIIYCYLSNRKFYVSIENYNSSIRSITAGTAQGSIISPTLFNIYISDMPIIKNINAAIYADDTALFCSSFRLDTINNRLKLAINKISKYFNNWKIKLNTDKTEFIIFTKRRPKQIDDIVINGANVSCKKVVKYLGVQLDRTLNFNTHTNNRCNKTIGIMCKLFPLLSRNSKINLQNKLLIYKLILRPVLTYACPIWSYISKTKYNQLQIVQNKCLRIITNSPKYTKIHHLHTTTNMPLIEDYIIKLTKKFFENCSFHENPYIRDIGNYTIDSLKYRKYKHKRIKHKIL